jgi:hypothetical protein
MSFVESPRSHPVIRVCRIDQPLTRHARVRLQQRGIPAWFLKLLVEHGRAHHDGHGAVIRTVDRAMRNRLRETLTRSDFVAAERWLGVYAVVATDDQAIVTAAYRTRRQHLH